MMFDDSVTIVETVVHLADLEVTLEFASGGVLVNGGELDAGNAGEVLPSLTADGSGHAGVVRSTGAQPALGGGLQVRTRNP